MKSDELNELSKKIIGIAIEVHKNLGPGFKETVYQQALAHELRKAKINFVEQKVIKVKYKGLELGPQRLDFLIDDNLILELKAVNMMISVHKAQLLSYLKTTGLKLGLLLNFSKPILEIKRIVNNF